MSAEPLPTTRADAVYERLRADILGGRLRPGARLKFPELSEQYETSVGAAREALTRLIGDGFVRSQARKGYSVAPLSQDDLRELTEARLEIESLVLRLSIRDGDMEFEARAVAAHHVLARTEYLSPDDPTHPTDAWAAAHAAFHQALLAGCRNRRLLKAALALRGEAELYRQWSVSLGGEPDRDLATEHRLLLEATIARDPDLAEARLRAHLTHTTALLIAAATDDSDGRP